MELERKFIHLADCKALDSGSGGFEGYPNITNILDGVGDIIQRGAYADTKADFLYEGWVAPDHQWGIKDEIGVIADVHEDDKGLFVKAEFHDTQDAQDVRKKVAKRIELKKSVKMSIGFKLAAPAVIIKPSDYASEIPKYVNPETLQDALEKAKRFSQVRVLSKIKLYEVSIVSVPANTFSEVTAVKSAEQPNVKGMFEDRLAEKTNSFSNLCQTLSYVLSNLQYTASSARDAGLQYDAESLLDEALNEFTARIREAFLSSIQSGDYWDVWYYMSQTLQDLSVKSGAVSTLKLDEHSAQVVSAIAEFATQGATLSEALKAYSQRCKDKQEFRASTKEGRTISQATANQIQTAKTEIDDTTIPALQVVSTALADLLELAKPKEKGLSLAQLQAQTLRLQTQALSIGVRT